MRRCPLLHPAEVPERRAWGTLWAEDLAGYGKFGPVGHLGIDACLVLAAFSRVLSRFVWGPTAQKPGRGPQTWGTAVAVMWDGGAPAHGMQGPPQPILQPVTGIAGSILHISNSYFAVNMHVPGPEPGLGLPVCWHTRPPPPPPADRAPRLFGGRSLGDGGAC